MPPHWKVCRFFLQREAKPTWLEHGVSPLIWDGLLCCQASQEGGAQHSGRAHGYRVGWTDFIFTGHTALGYRSTSTASDSSLLKWRRQQPRSPRGTPMIKSENTWKNLGTTAGTQHTLKETSGQNQTLAYVREDLYHWAVLPALATQLIAKKKYISCLSIIYLWNTK